MTSEEEAEMQKLHGQVKRYRSRIVQLKQTNAELRALLEALSARPADREQAEREGESR